MVPPKSSFASLNLHHHIAKAIEICGYTDPTPIQAQSIPPILEKKDLVACAQTGSGKTAAFVLPALQLLSKQSASKKPRILILTPTRELASQITKASRMYGKFLHFNIVNLVGGMPYHHQIKDLQRGADIIVATPGRLLDHIEQGRVDLSGIQMLVLDEADRMLDMGFIEDVEYIAKLTPKTRQTLLFSATIDKELANVVKHLLNQPVRIDLTSEKISAPQIEQIFYRVNTLQQKTRLLEELLNEGNIFKAIIFSATKVNTEKLAHQLRDDGFPAAALHGDLRQNVRNRTVEQLRNGKIQFLVATDVAARGIDIRDVTHVINYDLPRFCEDYVHRIGRTGRAGKTGIAISFVNPADIKHLQRIERYLGQRFKVISTPGDNEFNPERKKSDRKKEHGKAEFRKSDRHQKQEYKPEFKKSKKHKHSDFKKSEGRRSENKKFESRNSDFKKSADRKYEPRSLDFKKSDRRKPEYRDSEDRNSDFRKPEHRKSERRSSEYGNAERRNSDFKKPERRKSEHRNSDHKKSDHKKPFRKEFKKDFRKDKPRDNNFSRGKKSGQSSRGKERWEN